MRDALDRLDDAGFVGFLVGGSVRDFLLGRDPKDHDLVTDAKPEQLEKIFPEALTVGKAFGVLKIPLMGPGFKEGACLEIATFREDSDYEDYRHPKAVRFAGPLEDAQRRDFTVNALFYDPKNGRVVDFTDGLEDLGARRLRAIGVADVRFQEDALRLLRAVRLSTTLGFEIEERTSRSIEKHARLIKKVSGERVRDELQGMLLGPRPEAAIALLAELGLVTPLFPELAPLVPTPAWKRTLKALQVMQRLYPQRELELALAVLLFEIAKKGAIEEIQAITARLKLSRAQSERVVALIHENEKFQGVFQMREATLQRWVREPFFADLLRFQQVIATADGGNLMPYEFCRGIYENAQRFAGEAIPKLVTGADLIGLGFQPGPTFTKILRTVEDMALERKLTSKEQALEFVIRTFVD